MNLLHFLQDQLRAALTGYAPEVEAAVSLVRPTQDPKHGDYQANCAMSLAKQLGEKPREVAAEIVRRLPTGDALQPPEIAGPGFINFRFRDEWLAAQLQEMAGSPRLGIIAPAQPRTYVIDYSSPNVAKPLHVGHLRSTIIGDSLARLLRFLGHSVITDNHLGDWGTQFGMILYGYKHFLDEEAFRQDPVEELARLYKKVQKLSEDEEKLPRGEPRPVTDAARQETARLHAGDVDNLRLWKSFMPYCKAEIDEIYRRLDVKFDYELGESAYHDRLPGVVDSLLQKSVARESEGAIVIFLAEDQPPAIVRKSDGAFTYTTSDLATIEYRIEQWHPDEILYVVDFRQTLHFKNLFEAARRCGFDNVGLKHISFGSILGEDGKPLSTRKGTGSLLCELLDSATAQARRTFEQVRQESQERGEEISEFSNADIANLVEIVGVGAVKYADLSQNRTSDYKFNLAKMLAMDGNTATYMQYAYVRNRGIFRKGGENAERFQGNPPHVLLKTAPERALGLALLRFGEALDMAAAEYQPSAITSYLWELSKSYSTFFVHCPVLKAETPELRESRLLLCDLTARVIRQGLDLLGIKTAEKM
jgi:arginyl-tRNA synthetase